MNPHIIGAVELCGGPLDGEVVEYDPHLEHVPTWAVPIPWDDEELEAYRSTWYTGRPVGYDEEAQRITAQLELSPPYIAITSAQRPSHADVGRPAPGFYRPVTLTTVKPNGARRRSHVLIYQDADEERARGTVAVE